MDYQEILKVAQQNSEKQIEFLRKKSQNGRKGPDPNAVARFKARQEREQRAKMLKFQQEKERLLALRAQSSKSLRKASMMKSRTKDNDFGKIVQTDEDRYLEEKIKERSICDTKERMKARIDLEQKLNGLNKKQKERMLAKLEREEPVKVKQTPSLKIQDIVRQSKQVNGDNNKTVINKKPPRPPPPSYDEILNMAMEKSKTQKKLTLEEEIKAEIEFKQKQEQKQREQFEQKYKQQHQNKPRVTNNDKPNVNRVNNNNNNKEEMKKEEKYSNSKSNNNNNNKMLNKISKQTTISQQPLPTKTSISSSRVNNSNGISRPESNTNKPTPKQLTFTSTLPTTSTTPTSKYVSMLSKANALKSIKIKDVENDNNKIIPKSSASASLNQHRNVPSSSSASVMNKRPINKNPIPSGHNNKPMGSYPPPGRPKLPPIGATYRRGLYDDYRPMKSTSRDAYYDDEEEEDYGGYEDDEMDEEYDDDMADFIDDGPIQQPEEEEYSKHIREIFGYDKRKYRNIDDDDEEVEVASYGQCMKEEMRSLREGIKEDLEDIRREEKEKRLKLLQKKAKLKGLKGY